MTTATARRPTPPSTACCSNDSSRKRAGDFDRLTAMLCADVVVYNDGGGKARAARRPIRGRENVIAFVLGLLHRYGLGQVSFVEINGQVGVETVMGGAGTVFAVHLREGRIASIFAVLNPDKLTRVAPRT
jgi:RNA polymerase sigma-70 factor (ECF subfamily)